MVGPSSPNPKALHPTTTLHHHSSLKPSPFFPPPPPPTLFSSVKLKNLLQTFIFSHLYPLARALTKAKSFLLQILKDFHQLPVIKKHKNKNRLAFGSFRLHYNWCSSHVIPMSTPVRDNILYYDSSWNSIITADCGSTKEEEEVKEEGEGEGEGESQLSGYLEWLEERASKMKACNGNVEEENEIDKLADMFIASCHEKFRLEKQESYRRFQEMMARSV